MTIKYKVVSNTPRGMTAVDPNSPLWLAWVRWVESEDYIIAQDQICNMEDDMADGALWGAFYAGYLSADYEHNAARQKLIDQNLPTSPKD